MYFQPKTWHNFVKGSSGQFLEGFLIEKKVLFCNYRVESHLVNFEYQVGVKQRWKKTDKDYIAAQNATLLNRKEALHSYLRAAVVRRHFLLNLKAKYAGQRMLV